MGRLVAADDSVVVFLDSNGGDYREGLLLATLFKTRKVRTVVVAGDVCISACAIAFLGGTAYGEEGTEPFARSIAPNARLGFTRRSSKSRPASYGSSRSNPPMTTPFGP